MDATILKVNILDEGLSLSWRRYGIFRKRRALRVRSELELAVAGIIP